MRPLSFLILILLNVSTCAQEGDHTINSKEVERIERVLASDEMLGRRAGTPGLDKAGRFISEEFKKAGLQPLKGSNSFDQSFKLLDPKFLSASGEMDGAAIDPKNIIAVTTKEDLKIDETSGYEFKTIPPDSNMMREAYKLISGRKNYIVFVNESYAKDFNRIIRFKQPGFESPHSVVFILANNTSPKKFIINARHMINAVPMSNIVGILPGKTKPDEYVIFSAHYDHLGIGKAVNSDSIFNGANDDAAGTTAVIALARHFRALGNNGRTVIFAAFTAEESGGFGSQYFSQQLDPRKVVAMFNIEMIGTESKWGKNSAYITGYDQTNMGTILQKNLEGTAFKFYPDPYPEQDLFYRSDNATLARLGVPAHTVSTSKMDSEKFYHTVDDEVETLDLQNMTAIITAIARSSRSIIEGKDTPTRVDTKRLR